MVSYSEISRLRYAPLEIRGEAIIGVFCGLRDKPIRLMERIAGLALHLENPRLRSAINSLRSLWLGPLEIRGEAIIGVFCGLRDKPVRLVEDQL